jgi:energy-converting hydrogenase B subunit D
MTPLLVLQALVLLGLIVTAVLVVVFKDLLSSAIAFAAFSLLLALEFYLLQAPDVAIAEAGIGAGLTTAIFIIAIRGTKRYEEND